MADTQQISRLAWPTWPNLSFTDGGREQLIAVRAFLDELDHNSHPKAAAARAEFCERLAYLDSYGGTVSDEDPRRRYRIELHKDWSPLSFSVVWESLQQTGEYRYAFNGGLIYHGGSNDPLCVSLTPCLWGIHT